MTSILSVYWSPEHGREQDLEYIAQLQPYDVLILDPDVQQISDVYTASPQSEIVLRRWEWDDGRTEQDPGGVYASLDRFPDLLAAHHVVLFSGWVLQLEEEARRRGLKFPPREQLICHLINEPDTNHLMPQINVYTKATVLGLRDYGLRCDALNLGTGHPALLKVRGVGPDWAPLEASLEAIYRTGSYAVTHEYYNDSGINHPDMYPWHVGRADMWMPEGCLRKVGEFGLEQLVNNRADHHRGWIGVREPNEYLSDLEWYLNRIKPSVVSVKIYMTDFRDRVWASFDTDPIRPQLVELGKRFPVRPVDDHVIHLPVVVVEPDPSPPIPPTGQAGLYERSLEFVRRWEGGWSDNPDDPGGATMKGITIGTYRQWKAERGEPEPTKEDLRAITDEEVSEILRTGYWIPSGASEQPWPFCVAVFDSAVLHGPGVAAGWLNDCQGNIWIYLYLRALSYLGMGHVGVFGKGWRNRLRALEKLCTD